MAGSLDLNYYLGKEIHCSCGHTHYSAVKRIDIDKGAVKRLPEHIRNFGYQKIFMVADKNTWKAAGQAAADALAAAGIAYDKVILDYDEVIPDEHVIGEILAAVCPGSDLILAVGSGTINDLCKLISFRMGLDYIIYGYDLEPEVLRYVPTRKSSDVDGVVAGYSYLADTLFSWVSILVTAAFKV